MVVQAMKRILSALSIVLVSLILFVPRASVSGASDVLKVGTESTFPPFVFREPSGDLAGFEIDLVRAIASRLDKEALFIDMAFDALLPSLSGGRIDLIAAGLSITPERLKRADFSKPYFFSRDAIVVRDEENVPGSMDDLAGKNVTVQARTIQDDHLTTKGNVRLLRYESTGEALRAVLEGKADAAFMDGTAAERFLKDDPLLGAGLRISFSGRITSDAMGLAVRKIDSDLLRQLNEAIDALSSEGYLEELRKKWFD